MSVILGLDIGATKIAAGLVDASATVMRRRKFLIAPYHGDRERLWQEMCDFIGDLAERVDGIGVAVPGPNVLADGRIAPLNIGAWHGFPLKERLAERFLVPVVVDTDGHAAVVGESLRGALQPYRSAMIIIVSTGVGGGIIIDGKLLRGAGGNAGEVGHTIVVPNGRLCPCGSRGCLEAEIAGPALIASCGHPPPFEQDILARAGRRLGQAISSAGSLLDLEAVAVTGSVALEDSGTLMMAADREANRLFQIFGRPLPVLTAKLDPIACAAFLCLFPS